MTSKESIGRYELCLEHDERGRLTGAYLQDAQGRAQGPTIILDPDKQEGRLDYGDHKPMATGFFSGGRARRLSAYSDDADDSSAMTFDQWVREHVDFLRGLPAKLEKAKG